MKENEGGRIMDNQEQIQKLLEKMEANSRRQLFYSRIQFLATLALTVCCVLLLLRIRQFLPQIELLAAQAEQVMPVISNCSFRIYIPSFLFGGFLIWDG